MPVSAWSNPVELNSSRVHTRYGSLWWWWWQRWCLVAASCQTFHDPVHCKPTRLVCPWDFLGKNPGVSCHFLPRGLPTQGSDLCLPSLPYWRAESLPLGHLWSLVPLFENFTCSLCCADDFFLDSLMGLIGIQPTFMEQLLYVNHKYYIFKVIIQVLPIRFNKCRSRYIPML